MVFLIKNFEINPKKNIKNALKFVYGVNTYHVNRLQQFLGLKTETKIKKLTLPHIQKIKFFFENKASKYCIPDIYQQTKLNIKRLTELQNYKGIRHQLHLPVNGQRTHSNHKTCKNLIKNFSIKRKKRRSAKGKITPNNNTSKLQQINAKKK